MENIKISALDSTDKNNKIGKIKLKKITADKKLNSIDNNTILSRINAQIQTLNQDSDNGKNEQSIIKTAEGAVQSTVDILRTLKEKVINAANDTNTDNDRATIQKELDQAVDQIDDNANSTFNGIQLLDGSHNSEVLVPGTYTALTNESLSTDTEEFTMLTDLADRTGNSLQIQASDQIIVSYVKQGITYTSEPFTVGDNMVSQIFDCTKGLNKDNPNGDIGVTYYSSYIGTDQHGNDVSTIDGGNALTYVATSPGLAGQISGLTVIVQNRYGQPRTNANASLNNFQESIRAQDPSPDNAFVFQIGTKANQSVKLGLTDMRATALGLRATDGSTLQIGTQAQANAAINVLDSALKKALDQQTELGSADSRMDYTSANIVTAQENTTASVSTIRDADMAAEMTAYTKDNVIAQASQDKTVLSLFK